MNTNKRNYIPLFFNKEEVLTLHYYDEPVQIRGLTFYHDMPDLKYKRVNLENGNFINSPYADFSEAKFRGYLVIMCKDELASIDFFNCKGRENMDNYLDGITNKDPKHIELFFKNFVEAMPDLTTEIFNNYLANQLKDKPTEKKRIKI